MSFLSIHTYLITASEINFLAALQKAGKLKISPAGSNSLDNILIYIVLFSYMKFMYIFISFVLTSIHTCFVFPQVNGVKFLLPLGLLMIQMAQKEKLRPNISVESIVTVMGSQCGAFLMLSHCLAFILCSQQG